MLIHLKRIYISLLLQDRPMRFDFSADLTGTGDLSVVETSLGHNLQ